MVGLFVWNRIHYNTWHDKRHVRSFWYGPWTSKVWKSLRPYETTMDTSRLLDLGIRHHIQRSWYQSRPWETMAPQINTDTMPSSIPENWRCRVFENLPRSLILQLSERSEKLNVQGKNIWIFAPKSVQNLRVQPSHFSYENSSKTFLRIFKHCEDMPD